MTQMILTNRKRRIRKKMKRDGDREEKRRY
jgi:hypothetical protein